MTIAISLLFLSCFTDNDYKYLLKVCNQIELISDSLRNVEPDLTLALKEEIYEGEHPEFTLVLDTLSTLINIVPRNKWPENISKIFSIDDTNKVEMYRKHLFVLDSTIQIDTVDEYLDSNYIKLKIDVEYSTDTVFTIYKTNDGFYQIKEYPDINKWFKYEMMFLEEIIRLMPFRQEYGIKSYCSMEWGPFGFSIQKNNIITKVKFVCNESRFPNAYYSERAVTAFYNQITKNACRCR